MLCRSRKAWLWARRRVVAQLWESSAAEEEAVRQLGDGEQSFQIYVKTLNGKSITLDVKASDSVLTVKVNFGAASIGP